MFKKSCDHRNIRHWMAFAGLLLLPWTSLRPAGAADSRIIDEAAIFSPSAIKDAEDALFKVKTKSKLPITIQTRKSAEGQAPDKLAINLAKSNAGDGLYLLILKDDRKIEMLWSNSFKGRITNDDRDQVRKAISDEFKKTDWDAGLKQGVAKLVILAERFPIGEASIPARPAPGVRQNNAVQNQALPVRQAQGGIGIITILMLGLGLFSLVRIVRGLMGGGGSYSGGGGGGPGTGRGQGYGGGYGGGPGYGGGGGGGFFSGMLGGLGGAVLGNWAYDKLSGHGHDQNHAGLGQGSESGGGFSGGSGESQSTESGQWSGADDGGDWGRQDDSSSSGGWSGGDSGGGDWSGSDSGGGDSGGGDW